MGKESECKAKQRSYGRVIGRRFLLGLFAGYVAYLPALELILYLTYGRVDKELFIYGLYLPFQLPLLLNRDFRETLRGDELILQLFSVAFMGLGALVAVKTIRREKINEEIENG